MSGVRLFVAIPILGEVAQEIVAIQHKLAAAIGASVRWTKPEQLHLTLRFLGSVREEQIANLTPALERACSGVAPIELMLSNLGCFPSRSQPRIIWAGVSNGAQELTQLAERVRTGTATFGDSRDSKPFVPHLTIGRSKDPGSSDRRVGEIIYSENPKRFGMLHVSELRLMKSELSRIGSIYSVIARPPLRKDGHVPT